MSRVNKRSLRDLVAMALSGWPETRDAGVVLSLSLAQLKLSVEALAQAVEAGGMDAADLQSHLIGVQHRCAALEDFTDECLSVTFLPLSDDDGGGAAREVVP